MYNSFAVENIEWVTPLENNLHALYELGRLEKTPKGSAHWHTTLTEEQVREIKSLLREGRLFMREIAEMFNVSVSNIEHIKYGNSWTHIS